MLCNHTGNICSSDFTIVGEVRHTWWSSPLWLTCKETGLHSSLRPIQYLTLCIVCMASAQTENVGEGRKAINDGHTLSKKDNGLTRMERNGPLCLSPGLFWNQNDWWVVHQEWRAFQTWLTFQSPYESNADDSHDTHPTVLVAAPCAGFCVGDTVKTGFCWESQGALLFLPDNYVTQISVTWVTKARAQEHSVAPQISSDQTSCNGASRCFVIELVSFSEN